MLARLGGQVCVFDPLVSRYDTRVHDRADARDGSFQSHHNRNIDSWSMSLADVVLADTAAHADYYRREFAPPDASVEVLPVGYDDAVFTGAGPEAPREDGVVPVLFYGNYLPLHGVDVIARAALLLRDQPHIRFELIGAGQTYGAVERFVRAHGLDNVTLTPRLPVAELPGRIAAAAICLGVFGVTAKATRVVPNKVYQCMAMDRPVVTARSNASTEHFIDGVHADLVPPGDAAALAAAVRRLSQDPARRRRVGSEAGRLARERFGARRIAEQFVAICARARARRES
jgi:glycosyltransferase involved in cell wall biosynthesis